MNATSQQRNESTYIEASTPLLQRNDIPEETPLARMAALAMYNNETEKMPFKSWEKCQDPPYMNSIFFGLIVAAPSILTGMSLAFSAIALPQMWLNIDEASWFGSLPQFGSFFGSVYSGIVIDVYGRRPSLIFSVVPAIVGWLLLAFDSRVVSLFLGQFLAGIPQGCLFIGQIYAAESIVVNHDHLRNTFTTWAAIALSFGILLDYVLGRAVPYRTVAAIDAAVGVASLVGVCAFLPESPRWLFERGQIRRAKRSETRLNIHQPVLKDAYERPPDLGAVATTGAVAVGDGGDRLSWRCLAAGWRKLRRKDVYRPLAVTLVWNCLIVTCGGVCITAYMVNVLSDTPIQRNAGDASGAPPTAAESAALRGYDLSIVSGALVLVANVATSGLVPHLGVKKMFGVSTVFMAVGMAGLGVYGGQVQRNELWSTLHVVCVWLTVFFYSFGVVTITCSATPDMFPTDAKGLACVPTVGYSIASGLLVKLHPYLIEYYGSSLYYGYAAANLLTGVFVQFFVFETVGKTFDEIGEHFRR